MVEMIILATTNQVMVTGLLFSLIKKQVNFFIFTILTFFNDFTTPFCKDFLQFFDQMFLI